MEDTGTVVRLYWAASADPLHGSYRVHEAGTALPNGSPNGSFPGDPFCTNYDCSATELVLSATRSSDSYWLVTDIGGTGAIGPSGSYGY